MSVSSSIFRFEMSFAVTLNANFHHSIHPRASSLHYFQQSLRLLSHSIGYESPAYPRETSRVILQDWMHAVRFHWLELMIRVLT